MGTIRPIDTCKSSLEARIKILEERLELIQPSALWVTDPIPQRGKEYFTKCNNCHCIMYTDYNTLPKICPNCKAYMLNGIK